MLLLMDNCEHLVDAIARLVDQIIRHCPHVQTLVTSREPLGLSGESIYRVPSLSSLRYACCFTKRFLVCAPGHCW